MILGIILGVVACATVLYTYDRYYRCKHKWEDERMISVLNSEDADIPIYQLQIQKCTVCNNRRRLKV